MVFVLAPARLCGNDLSDMISKIAQTNREILSNVDEQATSIENIVQSMNRVEVATTDVQRHTEQLLEASHEVSQLAAGAAQSTQSIASSAQDAASAAAQVAQDSRTASSHADSVRNFARDIYTASVHVQKSMLISMDLTNLVRSSIEHSNLLTFHGRLASEALGELGRALQLEREFVNIQEIKSSHLRVAEVVRRCFHGDTGENVAALPNATACSLAGTTLADHQEVTPLHHTFHDQAVRCLVAIDAMAGRDHTELHQEIGTQIKTMEVTLASLFAALDRTYLAE